MNETQTRDIGEMDGAGLNLVDFLDEVELTTGAQQPSTQTSIPAMVGYHGRFYLDSKPGFTNAYEA